MVIITPSRTCAWKKCGNPFLPSRIGRPSLYCSRTCRQRVYEERRALRGLLEELLEGAEPTSVTDATTPQ